MKKTNLLTAVAVCALSAIGSRSYGQTFVPPVAYNFDYNSVALSNTPNVCHTANYSITNIETGFGTTDLYLGAWSSMGGTMSEVTYQFTAPGNPSSMLFQGTIPVANADEVTVGSVQMNGADYILIAYRYANITASYRMTLYRINMSTTAPLTFAGTTTLSTNTGGDGRISMDCHRKYGVAVVYPTSAGIETRVANTSGGTLVMSAGVTLAGTTGNSSPDVAFSHFNGGMNLHYVYYKPSTYELTESVLDYNVLLGITTPTTIAPVIEDINPLTASAYNFFRYVRPVIDCPDHYDVDNWAYTYTYNLAYFPNSIGAMPTEGIFVRFVDYHSAGAPTTVNVADGSMGNAPCLDYFPIFPTLCYGEDGFGFNTGQIHVAWYNQQNPTQDGGMFVAVHMREDGSGFLSMPDYLVIPNSSNSWVVQTSLVINLLDYYISPIALSKNSDAMFDIAPNFLYTTYLHGNPSSALRLNHAFHEWGNNSAYRGPQPAATKRFTGLCGTQELKSSKSTMQVQPNPFINVARATFSLPEEGKLQLQLSDLLGRVVWQQEAAARKGAYTAELDNLQQLPAGVYLLKSCLNGKPMDTQKIVKQQ